MEHLNVSNFDAKIANGASLVAFGAPWCKDCAVAMALFLKFALAFI